MIVAGLASVPARRNSLGRVIDSIAPQVDKLYVSLNGYAEIPIFEHKYDNVEYLFADNSRGDAEKFAIVKDVNGFFLSLDDDLVVPPRYVSFMIFKCFAYKAIVTLHGKVYSRAVLPIKSFRRSIKVNIRCLNGWNADTEVDVGGTGCMCFHTDFFKLTMDAFPYKNMADVQLSLEAHNQGVKIMALAHPSAYLQYIPPNDQTIWQQSKDDTIATSLLNKIVK